MRNNDSDSGRMGLRSYSPNSDNLTAGREGPQQQRKLKTNSRSANCTVHPTNGQIDGRCPDVTCEARRGVPYMTCRKMFYPLSPLCPQNLYCLSANLIHFLTPSPFSADVIYGSRLAPVCAVVRKEWRKRHGAPRLRKS